jgi:hypothetical protein
MKKVILIAVSLFTITTVTRAQEVITKTEVKSQREAKQKLTPEQRAQKNVDHLNSIVTLSEEQKPKALALALIKVKKIEEIHQKFKNDPEKNNKMHPEVEAVRQDYHKSIKALLTTEQNEKLKAKHAELDKD